LENAISSLADFAYWHSSEQAVRFRDTFEPTVIHTDFRRTELKTWRGNMVFVLVKLPNVRPQWRNCIGHPW
jgi:hypothetical protein